MATKKNDTEEIQLATTSTFTGAIAAYDDGIELDGVDLEKFSREEVGFHPYFTPMLFCTECKREVRGRDIFCFDHPQAEMVGNRFLATVISVDRDLQEPDEDKRFVRFTMQSQAKKLIAQSGPKRAPEMVPVMKGDMFTIGEYGTLPLHRYMGKTLLVTVTGKRPPSSKHPEYSPSYVFDVRVDQHTKALLDSEREELTRATLEAHKAQTLAKAGITQGQMTGAKAPPALPAASTTPAAS